MGSWTPSSRAWPVEDCSDTAHLSLLGYDPRIYYRGRGAFESMGAGLPMAPGDIAFKSNFATMDDASGIVLRRRADRQFEEEGPILCAALDGLPIPGFADYQVSVRYATEHRCGVVVRGPGLSGDISGTDPLKDERPLLQAEALQGEGCGPPSAAALRTARVVNALSDAIRQVPPFATRHKMRACMVAPTKIIAGLGLSLGISLLEVAGATGDYRTLLTTKARAVADALSNPEGAAYDFAFLHIKAIDDAGHDKAPVLKLRCLEAMDRMLGQLAALLWAAQQESAGKNHPLAQDPSHGLPSPPGRSGIASGAGKVEPVQFALCVTGDHSTPVLYGDHSYEPVPFSICSLTDFVKARGGPEAVASVDMGFFALPSEDDDIAVTDYASLTNKTAARNEEVDTVSRDVLGEARSDRGTKGSASVGDCSTEDEAGWRSAEGRAVAGDNVALFDEVSAAQGLLGRFPGCEMMGVVKRHAAILAGL
eukprot:TRINITY_DN7296_c0_g1_i1.p1 TRINITY_DN7296_c0_g1~~TRINITY_DN7296_c0_g1_i1.p1  ORF type:complete len:480 (-),score=91.07 TRINITY_DN7296_c0_g1_i1:277-1716(-)